MFSKTKLIPLTILFYCVFLQTTLFISGQWSQNLRYHSALVTMCIQLQKNLRKANDIDMIVLVGEFCFIVMYYSLHSGTVIIKITIKEGVRR